MKRTQIYLTVPQHEQASRLALEVGQSLSDVVREALDEYLARRKRQRMEFLGALDRASGVWRQRADLEASAQAERGASWPAAH